MFSPRISASAGKALLLEQARGLESFHHRCSDCLHNFTVRAVEVGIARVRQQAHLQSASGMAPVADLRPQASHTQVVSGKEIGNRIEFLAGSLGGFFDTVEIKEGKDQTFV